MAVQEPVPDLLMVLGACIIAGVLAALVQPMTGNWDTVLFVIILFFLLWVIATKRGWSIPHPLLFIRSTAVSDLFLGLLLTALALAVSWFIGNAISHAYSDLLGIPAGLVVFGVIMLVVSAGKKWA